MNNCSFVGRMGANPKYYAGDDKKKSTLMFSLAVKKNFAVKQGEPDCYWLNFKAFGNQADVLNKHVGKGQLVALNCSANVETYKDKATQQERTTTNFVVNQITFCEKSGAAANGGGASNGNASSNNKGSNYQPSQSYEPADDDDLPF